MSSVDYQKTNEVSLDDVRKASIGDGVDIAYATFGDPAAEKSLLLIHGYPQTLYAMRFLAARLLRETSKLFIVIADYRGAGDSSMPDSGYDKFTQSADLHALMTKHLKRSAYSVLGHDIGSMVATAQALQFRQQVEALIMMECPQPGTSVYGLSITDPAFTMQSTFHFFFHNAAHLPEQLTIGREDVYLNHFFDRLAFKPKALSREARALYVEQFARAGRMQAGFNVYRAFAQDDEDVKQNIEAHGRLAMPVLATGGTESVFTKYIKQAADELASDAEFAAVEDSSHWVPEENPDGLARLVVQFLTSKKII